MVIYIMLTTISPAFIGIGSGLPCHASPDQGGARARRRAPRVRARGPRAAGGSGISRTRRSGSGGDSTARRAWMMSGHVNAFAFLGDVSPRIRADSGVAQVSRVAEVPRRDDGAVLPGREHAGARHEKAPDALPRVPIVGFAERLIGTRCHALALSCGRYRPHVRAQNEPPARERTEVLIAAAVSDLFARLPRHLQIRFADVPRRDPAARDPKPNLRARQAAQGHPAPTSGSPERWRRRRGAREPAAGHAPTRVGARHARRSHGGFRARASDQRRGRCGDPCGGGRRPMFRRPSATSRTS